MNKNKLPKVFLVTALGLMTVAAAEAQQSTGNIITRQQNRADKNRASMFNPSVPAGINTREATATFKTTAAGSRRYDHVTYSSSVSTSAFQFTVTPMWQDSTILQNYSTGLGSINFSSFYQALYPFDTVWNNPTNPDNLGKIKVTSKDSYNIDSVAINGVYLVGTKGGASVVDTLEISLAVQPSNVAWYVTRSDEPKTVPFLPAGKDTMWFPEPILVDSVRRRVKSSPATAASYSWKEPLTPAMREVLSSATTIKRFAFKVPASFKVPAGNMILVSYTFRSGDKWRRNLDTFQERHHFRAQFAYPGTATASDLQPYRWYDGDRSMSGMMFSFDSSSYASTINLSLSNTPTQSFNQWLVNTITISCATCGIVEKPSSVTENNLVTQLNAFPNPANDQLHISFTAKESAEVTVSLSNMLGQVISSQNLGNTVAGQRSAATFHTGGLSTGMYFYTIASKGQRLTNRVSIMH